MRDKLREYGIKQPIAVIPTGLPPQSFGRIATNRFRERHGLETDAFVLLYVGRVAHEKNIDFLITMFQRLPERAKTAVLLIAGEGPALGALRARALASPDGDRILFVGYLDRETELLACYQTSDVFVFASETETQGLVLLEAMASGLPVVSTARMGTRDVLVDGEGCVVSPLDADAFAERVMRLYDSPAQRALLSGSAVAYARCWASDAKAFEMVSCYERTLQAEAGEPGKTMDATSVRADVKAE
jgi:glycosyltransferase involved in cell wall biosynthesis